MITFSHRDSFAAQILGKPTTVLTRRTSFERRRHVKAAAKSSSVDHDGQVFFSSNPHSLNDFVRRSA